MAALVVIPLFAKPYRSTVASSFGDIPDGVYAVGSGIAPGVYRVGRYWERRDRNQSRVENGLADGCPTILVVRPTDAFVEIAGGASRAESSVLDPIAQGCTSGMFLVGRDIVAGDYLLRADSSSSAYWSRRDSKLALIANELGAGDRVVTVRASDFAVEISGGSLHRMP